MEAFRCRPELLVAFREGRPEALEQVYRAYVRSVEPYLRNLARVGGRAEMAQASAVADLLQEVFIRAFSPSARRAYDGLRDYGPYLMTIARNCFVDAARVRDRDLSRSLPELPRGSEGEVAEPRTFIEPKISAVLTAYVAGLPDVLKAVCEQRFVLGQSQEEVSAALGLSRRGLRTAEAQLRRGLRQALVRARISLQELRPAGQIFPTRNPTQVVPIRERS
jgi:RNA polymerase sigma-70 factor (ECF subfamily)